MVGTLDEAKLSAAVRGKYEWRKEERKGRCRMVDLIKIEDIYIQLKLRMIQRHQETDTELGSMQGCYARSYQGNNTVDHWY